MRRSCEEVEGCRITDLMAAKKSELMMHTNKSIPPFKVGASVTTQFRREESAVVRKITSIEESVRTSSGWAASVDGGIACPTCNRLPGTEIINVDSDWFEPV